MREKTKETWEARKKAIGRLSESGCQIWPADNDRRWSRRHSAAVKRQVLRQNKLFSLHNFFVLCAPLDL